LLAYAASTDLSPTTNPSIAVRDATAAALSPPQATMTSFVTPGIFARRVTRIEATMPHEVICTAAPCTGAGRATMARAMMPIDPARIGSTTARLFAASPSIWNPAAAWP
jgi:hypothetical protein